MMKFCIGDVVKLTDGHWHESATVVDITERNGVELDHPLDGFNHYHEDDLELVLDTRDIM